MNPRLTNAQVDRAVELRLLRHGLIRAFRVAAKLARFCGITARGLILGTAKGLNRQAVPSISDQVFSSRDNSITIARFDSTSQQAEDSADALEGYVCSGTERDNSS
jgi:hypothetical protein